MSESISNKDFHSSDNNIKDKECSICYCQFTENHDYYLINKCNHDFHKSCLERWLDNASSCPICRSHIDEDRDIFPNYKMKKRRIGDNIETFSDNDNVSSNITDRDYENSNYYTSTTSEDLLNLRFIANSSSLSFLNFSYEPINYDNIPE